MSLKQNGKKICRAKYVDSVVAGEKTTESLGEKFFSKEKIFRGFEKRPIVLLERCNIMALLNNHRAVYKQKVDPDARCNEIEQINLHLKRLALQCSVMLVREDLGKLKEDFLRKNHNENTKIKAKVACKSFNGNMRRRADRLAKDSKDENRDPQPRKRVSFSERIIVHVVADYHGCRKCTKIFKDYKRLKLHIRRRHEGSKRYICNYCAKEFLDRATFTSHIKLHCDICGLLTQSKVEYMQHRRNVCRCKKKYICKTCNCSYFKLIDLKEHSYEHIGALFICDICKDQFESKCSLVHHISFLHSEKPPEELYTYCKIRGKGRYLCKFCSQSSIERDTILSHTAMLPDLKNQATTSYEDYHFCNQCLKRFETETNMLQHKQSHRKVETSNTSQLKQDGQTAQQTEEQNRTKANNNNNEATQKEIYTNKKGDDNTSRESSGVSTDSKSVEGRTLYSLLKPCSIENQNAVNVNNLNLERIDYSNPPKKAIVDPKSKKTIISRHNCEVCNDYITIFRWNHATLFAID